MKLTVAFLLTVTLSACWALEREQDGSAIQDASEQTTQVPVVELVPKGDKDDSDSSEEDASGPARCSKTICRLKCQINGCIRSQCLDDDRCSCYCPRYTDPFEQFFRSILTSHREPGLTIRRRPVTSFPSFGISPFGGHDDNGFIDFRKLFEEAASSGGVHAKVYRTMQHTCRTPEDCSAACTNCTQTQCEDNLCRCSQCSREGIESRSTNVLHTCRSAQNCAEHCKGCVVTTCRYGACECGQCSAESDTTVTPDVDGAESTTSTTSTTEPAPSTTGLSDEAAATTEPTTEILTVRTNETLSAAEAGHSGKCVPTRCNHSCWERQCPKWHCAQDRCECEGCPDEVSVVVKNVEGKPEKLQEDNTKYEIIF